MNVFNIERAFRDKARRGWDRLYVCIDVHDVILEGKYNRMNVGASYFPNALKVLRQWSNRPDMILILWSSSHDDALEQVLADLRQEGVKFEFVNGNPECPNTPICNFDRKFYFNILLDDKAGFEGESDWKLIEDELVRVGEWVGAPEIEALTLQ